MAIPIHAVQSVPVAGTATVEERGAIFTRREVADFILDLVGYTTRHPLHKMRLLEPSFGEGSFLFPALERLLSSYRAGNSRKVVEDLKDAVRCVELDGESVARTRTRLKRFLIEHDLTADQAKALGDAWLIHDNFLLTDKLAGTFTHVVGNPPYIRQERVPEALMAEYRRRYHTIYDRADIYVPFIERSLSLLAERGVLGFICADRWMKNRYGGPLRELVATQYHLRAYVDMANADAFQSEVIAYPAIFSIAKEKGDATRIAHNPTIAPKELAALAKAMTSAKLDAPNVKEIGGVVHGREPWILESADQIALIRRLEGSFPTLEEAGCKVGIGVATGADKVFIRDQDELDIESDRKVPLIMARDLRSGKIQWGGKVVINPFHDGGGLVPLSAYPKLARYFKKHGEDIRKRHVSQKNPHGWYRTIDRIYPALTSTPKLLIPDIKNEANIVYDAGHYYPHHNLYYVTSEEWDLRALQAVLLSTLTRLCIATYTTKMRGGYLRFQAQYLRRIRLPRWQTVSTEVRKHLIAAAKARDIMLCDEAVALLYNLSSEEKQTIGVNGIK